VLHLDCAFNRPDDTRKFNENAIAGSLDDPTLVLLNLGVNKLVAKPSKPRKRANLILPYEATVAGNICCQYRRQFTLDPPTAHLAGPKRKMITPKYDETHPDASAGWGSVIGGILE
jgi:hypothetical protein